MRKHLRALILYPTTVALLVLTLTSSTSPSATITTSTATTITSEVVTLTDAEEIRHQRRYRRSAWNSCGVRNINPHGGAPHVRAAVAQAAREHGVSVALMNHITARESRWTPTAANPRSSARGLQQHLTKPSWGWYGRVRTYNAWARRVGAQQVSSDWRDPLSMSRVTAFMLSGKMGRTATRAWDC